MATVTVRASKELTHNPEAADFTLAISATKSDKEESLTAVSESLEKVKHILDNAEGDIEWFSEQVYTSAYRGDTQKDDHEAFNSQQIITVSLMNFGGGQLSWFDEVAKVPNVEVHNVKWKLCPDTEATIRRELLIAVVKEAREKADAYAEGAGSGVANLIEVADPGLLQGAAAGSDHMGRVAGSAYSGSRGGFDFKPRPIVLTAQVEARFSLKL